LNPGSAGPRRFRLPVTLARIEIAGASLAGYEHQHLPVTAITPRGGTPYVETAKLHVRGD